MPNDSLKISVLTPSYNSGQYLERAIASVMNQDYPVFEHIVMDGGSQDNTHKILKKYPHLNWRSEPDKGQSDAMNKAFSLSSGDIIVYLNADDWFEPGVFSEVIKIFKKAETDIVVGNYYIRDTTDAKTRLMLTEYRYNKILFPYYRDFPYNPLTYFYKRELQEKIGDFPVEEHFAMDYWFVLRAFRDSHIIKTGLVFGTYFHTGQNKSSIQVEKRFNLIIKEFLGENNSNFKIKYRLRGMMIALTNWMLILIKKIIDKY